MDERDAARRRQAMVDTQLEGRGVADAAVLAAMRVVPRHRFVPAASVELAYDDSPLALGHEQTISQPYVVAVMTERARVTPGARVLEIGTGSGYQTAVLRTLGAEVWSVELVAPLAERAAATLGALGYAPHLRIGDGWAGWPEAAPFDAIVVTAAPPAIPPALVAQLAPGGRMVIPVGDEHQELVVVHQTARGAVVEPVFPVRFVPMVHGPA